MTAVPLVAPLYSSPLWQLLRFRLGLGFPEERALVFLAADGFDRTLMHRNTDYWSHPRPTARALRQGEFPHVVWVSLVERRLPVDVLRRPPQAPAQHEVVWKVSDPVAAARAGLTEERAEQLVREHIDGQASAPGTADPLRKPPRHLATAAVAPPGQPLAIEGWGLTYWFLGPPAGLLPAGGGEGPPVLPVGFGEAHREAYRFYREVVSNGPVGLAALWLLHRPEEARDVLDWTVAHRDLLSDPQSWERSLAATLRSLTPEDRGFVGANVARVLSDVGVPEADEVLHRINGTGPSENGEGGRGVGR